jgi:uncharacterized repeat protein (TIGR01451 family)
VDLALTEAVDSGPMAVGSNLGYTFTVANQGTTMATGVTLTHMLPASATFVSAVASQGTYTLAAGTVAAALGTIAGGANATLRIVVQPQAIGSMIEIAGFIHADQFLSNLSQGTTSIPVDFGPASPTNVATSVQTTASGSSTILVQWTDTNPPGSAVTFNVYRSETPRVGVGTPYTTGVTADQFTDAAAVPGHVYYYQVSAVAGVLVGNPSAAALGTILTAPTITQPDLAIQADGGSSVTIHWTYPSAVGAPVTFKVYQSTTPGGEGATPYKTGVGEDLSRTDAFAGDSTLAADAIPTSTYYYEVSAVVAGHEGPRSAEAIALVPPLPAPAITSATGYLPDGTPYVGVSWSTPGVQAPLLNYALLISYDGGKTYPYASYGPGTVVGGGQLPGSTADYQVYSYVGSYVSDKTILPVTVATFSAPFLTVQLAGMGSHESADLSWSNPLAGVAEPVYNVYDSETPIGAGAIPYEAGFFGNDMSIPETPGSTHYYQVSAVVSGDLGYYEGPRSSEVVLTIPGTPLNRIRQINILPLLTGHAQKASDLVVDFTGALNPTDAADLAAYHLVTLGKLNKKTHQQATKPVKVTSAVYNPATDTVTLAVKGKLPNQPLQLSVNTSSVLDASGQPIAGTSGQSGGTFQTTFGKKGITL